MELGIILNRFKQCFDEIPEKDNLAKIGPRQFLIVLIFSLSTNDFGKRSLETLRKSIMKATEERISRGSFWERMAPGRLFHLLLLLVTESIRQMGNVTVGHKQMQDLLEVLKVRGILVLDSSFMTLPEMAGAMFPGPRKNNK